MQERRMRPGTTQSGRGSSGCARSHWPLIPNHRPECDVWCCSGVLCGDVEKVCASRGPRVSIRSTVPVPLADCSRSHSHLNMFAILFHKPFASFAFSSFIQPLDTAARFLQPATLCHRMKKRDRDRLTRGDAFPRFTGTLRIFGSNRGYLLPNLRGFVGGTVGMIRVHVWIYRRIVVFFSFYRHGSEVWSWFF